MELSIFLAKVIGLYLIINGLSIISKGKTLRQIINDFGKNSALMYLTGIVILIIGILIVVSHNIWEGPAWIVIITILGWLTLIKGIMYLMFSAGKLQKISSHFSHKNWYSTAIVVYILIGLFLAAKGFGLM